MSGPARHLRDPNYYRLGYRLAEMRANALPEHPAAITAGVNDARRLRCQVGETLAYLEAGDRPSVLFWRALEPHERLLQRFLAGTIEPCITFAIAVFELQRADGSAAVAEWGALREHGPRRRVTGRWPLLDLTAIPWSVWAYVNLTGFGAMARERGHAMRERVSVLRWMTGLPPLPDVSREEVDIELWAIGQALRMSHGEQLARLLDAVDKDPMLKSLRDQAGEEPTPFELLLERARNPATRECAPRRRPVWATD